MLGEMNNPSSQYPSQGGPRYGHPQRNSLGDFRQPVTNGPMPGPLSANGPVPVPPGRSGVNGNGYHGHAQRPSGPSAFNMSRSPPGSKNTSHVPCKFFLQGNCQAGSACPFKHTTEGPQQVEVCKYFMKGNCKYGRKCLLEHVGPDGTRFPNQLTGHFSHAQPDGRAQAMDMPPSNYASMPTAIPSGHNNQQLRVKDLPYNGRHFDNQNTLDRGLSSYPSSAYSSPPNDNFLALSPSAHAQRALDAPFPSSFDSQAISNYAAYGKTGTSVPSRFGFMPVTSTSPTTSTAQSQAFANLDHIATSDARIGSNPLGQYGASPPTTSTLETQPRRIMPVDRRSKPRMISSSLPVRDQFGGNPEEDVLTDNDRFQEDLLPGSLTDLMTPQEKMRRFSRNDDDGGSNSFRHQSLSGLGSPGDSKVGSPSQSSPSRYSALFMKQQQVQQQQQGSESIGHVGSPLRNSSLHVPGSSTWGSSNSPNLGPISRPPRSGDVSPHVSSPPRLDGGMGMLSLQLQRTRLQESNGTIGSNPSPPSTLYPSSARTISTSSIGSALNSDLPSNNNTRQRYDRAISNTSVRAERIDEEPCVFSMDEEEVKAQLQNHSGSASGSGTPTTGAKKNSGPGGVWGAIGGQRPKMNGT